MAALQEVISELATDPGARAALQDDPQGFLVSRGLEGFTAEDVHDALGLAADGLPLHVAAHLTGPDLPPPEVGEHDQEAVLRLLDHAAATPEPSDDAPPSAEHGPDLDDEGPGVDLAFGAGSLDADDDGEHPAEGDHADGPEAVAADAAAAPDPNPDPELELDGAGPVSPAAEAPDPGQPEALSEQSEEAPDHWGDHHQDEGSLDPHELGDDLGDLPGA